MPDLVATLRRHTRLLREFSRAAFEGNDLDLLGEIAAKLRLLVLDQGNNKPLLLRLMKLFKVDLSVVMGGPPIERRPGLATAGDKLTLREYLQLLAYGIDVPGRGFVEVTKAQLIAMWAQEHGAAHEDWTLTEELMLARDQGLFIGGLPALGAELHVTANTVLLVAEEFLSQLTPERVAAAEEKRTSSANRQRDASKEET